MSHEKENEDEAANPGQEMNVSPEVIDAIERELDQQAKREEPVAGVKPKMSRPEVASKGLVLLWCLWLMGSWMIVASTETGYSSFKWMMMSVMTGLVVAWPFYRLSQEHPERDPEPEVVKKKPMIYFGTFENAYPMRPGVVLTDWMCLNLVMQALLWPVYLGPRWTVLFAKAQETTTAVDMETRWTAQQTLWMGLDLAAWSLLAGCVIVLGCRAKTERGRMWAMVGALGLVLGEPALMWLVNLVSPVWVNWPMWFTPVTSLWEISGQPAEWNGGYWVPVLRVTVCVAVGAWAGVAVWYRMNVSGAGKVVGEK